MRQKRHRAVRETGRIVGSEGARKLGERVGVRRIASRCGLGSRRS